MSKTATIEMGLTPRRLRRRRRALMIAWPFCLVSGITFVCSVLVAMSVHTRDAPAVLVVLYASVLGFLIGVCWAELGAKIVTATKIDKYYLRFKGVHPQYLDMLPQWDGL